MEKLNWNNFCVVGLGNHAKSKLIPALVENKIKIKGLVTSQNINSSVETQIFKNINEALKSLDQNVVYLVSSPPKNHFDQVKQILKEGNDVVVEKPAFIKYKEIIDINKILKKNNNVLVEAFMHKHSNFYKIFLDTWKDLREKTVKLDIIFYVPEYPISTFRDSRDIGSSCLYDIGCYGLSLLLDMDLDFKNIDLVNIKKSKFDINQIHLSNRSESININLKVGISDNYNNSVIITTNDKKKFKFSPFFYGRACKKYIEITDRHSNVISNDFFYDQNSFNIMFGENRINWYNSQKMRIEKMVKVTQKLEEISNTIIIS